MTVNKARRVADNWKTSPTSHLGNFARAGIVNRDGIRKEIAEAWKEAEKINYPTTELALLREFIEK